MDDSSSSRHRETINTKAYCIPEWSEFVVCKKPRDAAQVKVKRRKSREMEEARIGEVF